MLSPWWLGRLKGVEGRPHLQHALKILKGLVRSNCLDAERKVWIARIEPELDQKAP